MDVGPGPADNEPVRLVERETQLASLAQYAEEARSGSGRMALVAGQAGVGKSSLLEHFRQELADARWLTGACDGLFTPRALGPLLDIADQAGGVLGELCRAGAPREQLFGRLLHELSGRDTLTVLAVEDVHWADEATLDLLRFVSRRIRNSPAMVVVTYRDDGLGGDAPLRVALGEFAVQRTTRRLTLPPLSERGVADLARGTGIEPGGLHRLTGGNPFFVTEVLQTTTGELPASVRDAVLARVAGLSRDARQVLDAAAMIGSRIPLQLLVSVTGASPAMIDELAACGVLTGEAAHLRFRHEIARIAVQTAIAPHRSVMAHRGILDALRAGGCDDYARLAFHAEGAGDDALVLEYAPLAGRRASSLAAHREAAAQFQRALRSAAGADARTAATLYDELANELSLVDRWQESADARTEALRRWQDAGDPRREGDSLRRLSRTMWRLCRGQDANQAAVHALALLEPLGPGPELAWAYANLATARMNQGEHVQSIGLARRAQAVAGPLELADVLSDALNTEGSAAAGAGADGSGPLHRALETARAHGLGEQAGRAYANLYSMYCGELRLAESEHIYVDGIAYCDEHDIGTFGTCLRGERTCVLEMLGRWDEAESLAAALLQQAGPSPVNRLNPLICLGKVRARRGAQDVWDCLDEAMRLADDVGDPSWIALAGSARAEARWLEGDARAAAGELAAAEDACRGHLDAFERGDLAAWRRRVTGARSPAPDLPEPFRSEVAGDHSRAARLWDDLGLGYCAALAMLGSGDESAMRDALTRLEALGATAAARLARQKMRELGVASIPAGARAATREHPAGLTRREQEVLELICEGLTNDEISGRLFLSVRTVGHHVSAVLGKLGVPSRRVAAAEAARLGLVRAAAR